MQLLCVLNGGLLIQDCDNHAGCSHKITNGIDAFTITSLHHQMIYPFNLNPSNYDILYWSATKRCSHYNGDKINPESITVEPEIAVFHREGFPVCLGVQGHPEMMHYGDLHDMLNDLILKYVNLQMA